LNKKVLIAGIVIAVPIIVILAMSFGRDPHAIRSPLVGREAPDFTLTAVSSHEAVSLADFRGKPVVVNFWATWCVPCYAEHEVLKATAAARGSSVQFLGVVYDDEEQKILQFLGQYGAAYPTLVDEGGKTAIAYGVYGVPETFFIKADGVIAAKYEGPLDPELLRQHIEMALN
jgi:cytochrome c biogenesis protein CcmG/thiol:disulfide interchange protein DsbE